LIYYIQLIRKIFTWFYIVNNVEMTISENGLTGESYWTFGQIFSMVNVLGLLGILLGHFLPTTVGWTLKRLAIRAFRRGSLVVGILVPSLPLAAYLSMKLPTFVSMR